MKRGYYWVSWCGSHPEIMRWDGNSWTDFADDPGAVPENEVRVIKGPLRAPSPAEVEAVK